MPRSFILSLHSIKCILSPQLCWGTHITAALLCPAPVRRYSFFPQVSQPAQGSPKTSKNTLNEYGRSSLDDVGRSRPTSRVERHVSFALDSIPASASVSSDDDNDDGTVSDRPPPWDRTVDVVWHQRAKTPDRMERDDEFTFQENFDRLAGQSAAPPPPESPVFGLSPPGWCHKHREQRHDVSRKDNSRYFALPDRVRFKVAKYVLASHNSGKPIRLNNPVYLDPIWPIGRDSARRCFDSLEEVLGSLHKYMVVCFAMRIDVLTTLFLTRRFYVIYSPFVTATTQPAAVLYMNRFGPLMKYISLEVDLSRLAGHWHPAAQWLDISKSLERINALVAQFADRQQTRRHRDTTMRNLEILVRRYYGHRPFDWSPPKWSRDKARNSQIEAQEEEDGNTGNKLDFRGKSFQSS